MIIVEPSDLAFEAYADAGGAAAGYEALKEKINEAIWEQYPELRYQVGF